MNIYTSLIYLCLDFICDFTIAVNINNKDANGRVVRRFHKLKTEWGIDQFLSRDTLNDSSNGYLVDDTYVFGVEVFVIKSPFKGECLSMINQPQSDYFTWKIDKYMTSKDRVYFSPEFTVEGRIWYDWRFANSSISVSSTGLLILLIYNHFSSYFGYRKLYQYSQPGGTELDTRLALYLFLFNPGSHPPNRKAYIKYTLRIRDQINSNHLEKTGLFSLTFTKICSKTYLSNMTKSNSYLTAENWFCDPNAFLGFYKFSSLRDIQDKSKGYLVGDALIFECKIDVISVVKDFSSK